MNRSRLILPALALAVGVAPVLCPSSASAQAAKTEPKALVTHIVVLPLSEGSNMVLAVHPMLPTTGHMTFWTPIAADLRKLEKDMPKSLTSYYRQYIGVRQGGKRLILINGFADDVASGFIGGKFDWHKSTASVMDGGPRLFPGDL